MVKDEKEKLKEKVEKFVFHTYSANIPGEESNYVKIEEKERFDSLYPKRFSLRRANEETGETLGIDSSEYEILLSRTETSDKIATKKLMEINNKRKELFKKVIVQHVKIGEVDSSDINTTLDYVKLPMLQKEFWAERKKEDEKRIGKTELSYLDKLIFDENRIISEPEEKKDELRIKYSKFSLTDYYVKEKEDHGRVWKLTVEDSIEERIRKFTVETEEVEPYVDFKKHLSIPSSTTTRLFKVDNIAVKGLQPTVIVYKTFIEIQDKTLTDLKKYQRATPEEYREYLYSVELRRQQEEERIKDI